MVLDFGEEPRELGGGIHSLIISRHKDYVVKTKRCMGMQMLNKLLKEMGCRYFRFNLFTVLFFKLFVDSVNHYTVCPHSHT